MPQQEENLDADFDSQLRGLFDEATQNIEGAAARKAEEEKEQEITRRVEERIAKSYQSVPDMIRPLSQALQAVTRITGDNTTVLQKIDKNSDQATKAYADLPVLIEGLQAIIDQKSGLNQKMFDAMHQELKGYKDGFLLESVHKPIIRDLLSLFDDLTAIHRQMQDAVSDAAKLPSPVADKLLARLKTMDTNIAHNCEFILEVLERLEVTMQPLGPSKYDMQNQRAVSSEPTEDPDDDLEVVRVAKRGFLWKGRPLRPEEVIIKKYKEGFLVALANPSAQK